ncbi:hypothetical protein D3C87_1201760 [compost metagenome]
MGSITSNGFVRAVIIPLIFGIFVSATPSAVPITAGKFSVNTSFPPSISRSTVAVRPSISNFLLIDTDGIFNIEAIKAPTCVPL